MEFDKTGEHLATGDRGGRVVLFERIHPSKTALVRAPLTHPSTANALPPATPLRTRARGKFTPRIRVDRARSTRRSRIRRAPNRTICPSRRRFPARRARVPPSRLRHPPPRHAAKIQRPNPTLIKHFWRRRRPTVSIPSDPVSIPGINHPGIAGCDARQGRSEHSPRGVPLPHRVSVPRARV